MGRIRVLLATIALAAPAAGAYAADMPGTRPLPLPSPPAESFVERLASGWYLRGDLGYRWGTLTGAQPSAPFASPSTNSLGNAITGGIGVGIKSDWLRTDLTLDLAGSQRYRGTVATPDDITARLRTTSILFNGYLDLGSWYGFTPYLGVGAGASNVKITDFSSAVAPPFTNADSSQWKFTLAGMAGVGLQVAPNTMLDFGYRYLNFGDVKTASTTLGSTTFRNVAAHEVRIGLRWSFDDIRRYR